MPTSFRKDSRPAPPRYRTPSPPRDAFEPLFPSTTAGATTETLGLRWADNAGIRNGLKRPYSINCEEAAAALDEQRHLSGGSMNAFASIALATKSIGLQQSITSSGNHPSNRYHAERPSKRARSEKLPSPDWARKRKYTNTRPTTSYEQSPEDRKLEAELLLNFAQAAAQLASPYPILSQTSANCSQSLSRIPRYAPPEQPIYDFANDESEHSNVEARIEEDEEPEATNPPNEDPIPINEPPSPQGILTHLVPPITVNIADRSQDAIELNHVNQRCLSPMLSEHDDADLILNTDRLEQDATTVRNETSDTFEDQNILEVSGPSSNTPSEDHLRLNEPNGSKVASITLSDVPPSLNDDIQVAEGDATLREEKVEEHSSSEAQKVPEADVAENESRTIHGALGDNIYEVNTKSTAAPEAPTAEANTALRKNRDTSIADTHPLPSMAVAVCAACNFTRTFSGVENEANSTSWISCDACRSWFHFACAGFKNEREVRSVDKFRCRKCKPVHGSTTYVRKSSRAHSAIDYAGLHQGVIKISDERPEHHYIKPIKEGSIAFAPENFARMRPELVTAECFEKGVGMKEPVVIPACFNPRSEQSATSSTNDQCPSEIPFCHNPLEENGMAEDCFSRHPELETVLDHGQDALDMVIPQGLTVRQVAELYGPEENVEVIDVKSQNGENKKWNMRRWADYYENPNNKVVRNVISLEVSQSKLGRLIRRPQIVRDLDLQDSVWPEDLIAKGEYPRVQFYCLMSVADCFTDFHIDFGGSSVFYHILKGKKTFLFIPPKEKYLKKYEEWCMSPAQNWTFLGDQTKECYRVDLSEGDTMLIPSGWIHAVWTPEDSLVIGGNFLTRMNYGMQLRVAQVEKTTGVARKFRYPHFQKLHWYTALRYLETDPLPEKVRDMLHAGGSFHRERPTHYDFDSWGENSRAGSENYHTRYYSQSELEGLPDLTRYLLRTALIESGSITDGISADTRNAVKKSIPRGHGEPLDVMKSFAAWCAWKRGNEPIPHWAYPDAIPETLSPDKLSAAAMKKLDREAALLAPRRQSARMQSQQELSNKASSEAQMSSTLSNVSTSVEVKRPSSDLSVQGQIDNTGTPKRPRVASGTGTNSHRKTACESCRKRRRACKHKDQVASSIATPTVVIAEITDSQTDSSNSASVLKIDANDLLLNIGEPSNGLLASRDGIAVVSPEMSSNQQPRTQGAIHSSGSLSTSLNTLGQEVRPDVPKIDLRMSGDAITGFETVPGNALQARPRHKACNECRKSKRRCIHDAYGNEDPVKVREIAIPRPHARKLNVQARDDSTAKKANVTKQRGPHQSKLSPVAIPSIPGEQAKRMAPIANMIAQPVNSECQMNSNATILDAATQRHLAERASLLLDPALFEDSASSFRREKEMTFHIEPAKSLDQESDLQKNNAPGIRAQAEGQYQLNASSAAPVPKAETAPLESRECIEQPASSLVSPPASSHDDGVNSPTTANIQWTSSRSSSEQSSVQPKQMQQRYTPESGPMRRGSSSYGEIAPEKMASSPIVEAPPDQKPRGRLSCDYMADVESLRLIKELQAQDLGLRRRGKP